MTSSDPQSTNALEADVIVVGAGPGGSAAAYYLAQAGVDVAILDKATFPRDKICGDGLTPAAVSELALMGIDTSGWARNRGLHVIGGGNSLYFEWPDQKTLPNYGMARARLELDADLLARAQGAGARLYEDHQVYAAIHNNLGRIVGVKARRGAGLRQRGGQKPSEVEVRAKLVVDASGVAARLSTSLGLEKNPRRPLGVAARTYFHSPRADEDWMESHLELWDGEELLPGYGWIFPLGNGVINVGLGSVSSTAKASSLPYKQVFSRWIKTLPEQWELNSETQMGPLKSAALPMSFNRKPHYSCGLALVGDAGGMVSPFNGEGIAPAMKAGRYLAQAATQALSRTDVTSFDRAMTAYPEELRLDYGGYYSLGRIFVRLIENPKIMRICTNYGLPRRRLMKLVNKLLSDGFERSGGDVDDLLITALSQMVPKV